MNFNLFIFIFALVVLIFLSVAWYLFFIYYLKRKDFREKESNANKIVSLIKPYLDSDKFIGLCPVELPNTDDDIANVIKYVSPANFARDLLENLYEQTGI